MSMSVLDLIPPPLQHTTPSPKPPLQSIVIQSFQVTRSGFLHKLRESIRSSLQVIYRAIQKYNHRKNRIKKTFIKKWETLSLW